MEAGEATRVIDPPGSRFDDRFAALLARPGARTAWRWGAPAAVLGLAAATRLIGLGHPDALVFDETYYVKDAWSLWNLGYEGTWPADANAAFVAGQTDGFQQSAAFVAHPPLGKWLIALGMAALGPGDPTGWRVAVALAGVALVAVTMLVAHLLWGRPVLTLLAGGLLAIDGNAIVMSRVALLDTLLALFALLGAALVLLDRRAVARRLDDWVARHGPGGVGPVLAGRPWLLAAGLALGLATGVKWSGLYVLAVFGVWVVVGEALLRRRAGLTAWTGRGALLHAPLAFLALVPVAAVTYLATWTGWFVTSGGYHREWLASGGERWTGALAWVPDVIQNWWHYEVAVYQYHVGENSPHGYQSNPLTWLLMVRPVSMYWNVRPDGLVETILDVANPLIWWASTAATVYLVVRVARRLRARLPVAAEVFILTGLAATYLPWLMYQGRTVFFFYAIAFQPFLILALTAALGVLLGSARDPESRRAPALRAVIGFLVASVVLSALFLPIWTGMPIPDWFFRAHLWLPSWL